MHAVTAVAAGTRLAEALAADAGGHVVRGPVDAGIIGQVLRLVAKGCAYRDIADHLVISVRTVHNHVQSILRKLQLQGRHELMRYAIHRGLDRDDG